MYHPWRNLYDYCVLMLFPGDAFSTETTFTFLLQAFFMDNIRGYIRALET